MLIFRDGVFRHAGSQGLPLGPFHDSGPSKEIYFTIWNRGTMPGFVLFNIELKCIDNVEIFKIKRLCLLNMMLIFREV